MSKIKTVLSLTLLGSLLLLYFFQKDTSIENTYYKVFPMSEKTYKKKLKESEQEFSRIMSIGYYSENKKEDLIKLKESLYSLKRNGARYETN